MTAEDSHTRPSSAPPLLYGTAWKERRTEALVAEALAAGFRGIDTANQRRHYDEAAVGAAIGGSGINRDQLFIQTKFTHIDSQDERLPYDPHAGYSTQVRQSFDSSLAHLGVDRLDSYLLHGPRTRHGFSNADREVWQTMEQLQRSGRVTAIGISNVTADQLAVLCEIADIKPSFVQNRCFAQLGWDREVRAVCKREGIAYQGFSLLTANVAELSSREVRAVAAAHGATIPQIIFAFAIHVGMIALTGTTGRQHMQEDLAATSLRLSPDEVAAIEGIAG